MPFLGTSDLAIPLISEAGSYRAQETGTAKRTCPSGPCQPQDEGDVPSNTLAAAPAAALGTRDGLMQVKNKRTLKKKSLNPSSSHYYF